MPLETLTQQSPVDAQACMVAQKTAAVNVAVTCTIPPPPTELDGYSIYLCGLDIAVSQDGTSAAVTNGLFTSTNIWGWAWKMSLEATANKSLTQAFNFPKPIKAQSPNQPVTIVSPAAVANAAYSINAYYYYAL